MRLGIKSSDEFIQLLNNKNESIQKLFLEKMKELTRTVTVKGMLGDSTIAEQNTFDPILVQEYFKKIIKNLPDWVSRDISITNNEDLRRIFVKFELKEGNYLLSCHMSIQFHVLLFYKPDNKVIEYQKELAEIIDKTKNTETKLAEDSDQYILEKLKEIGYKDLEHKDLFQVFYENDDLRDKIYKEIEGKSESNVQDLLKRKKQLFNELDNLLMEIYQTTSVLIDDSKLVTGEEGCLCSFDLEHFKNNVKEGMFDPKKIPVRVKEKLSERLDEFIKIMKL
ncbi:MAG: hypothetical protein XU09_C0008G0082 [Thaumarchaeota archaeon CSP1-1]|nr:MAG: hypothetical protein XU09_C0008G0082 [Thaumarchaeota archaeon CSP1-1]